jgi:hypothetical protein
MPKATANPTSPAERWRMEPMSDPKRGRNRRNVRLESLEGRCLLSAIKPAAVAAERIVVPGPPTKVSNIHAVISGTLASDPLYGGVLPVLSPYSGHGTSRPFGDVLFGVQFLPGAPTTQPKTIGVSSGTILLTTVAGGNQLRLFISAGTNKISGNLETWNWVGGVAGGTGRFTNAAGTFFATGSVPRNHLGRFNLSLNITLNPPV